MGSWNKDREGPVSRSYIGTGDIVDPRDKVHPPQDIDAMPQGGLAPAESWVDFQNRWAETSAKKKLVLATAFANGELRTPGQIKKMALELGCEERHIKRWKTDRTMAKHVGELLRVRALHAVAETLDKQVERAEQDTQAWRTLAQTAEVLGTGVVNVQNNTVVDARNGGDNEGDRQWAENFQKRQQRRFAVVEGTAVEEAK